MKKYAISQFRKIFDFGIHIFYINFSLRGFKGISYLCTIFQKSIHVKKLPLFANFEEFFLMTFKTSLIALNGNNFSQNSIK